MNAQERFNRLIDELKGVRDAVEQLYTVLDHVYRNREELAEILQASAGEIEETVLCRECSLEAELIAALRAGWIEVELDTDGGAIGFCPHCQERELAEVEAANVRPESYRDGRAPIESSGELRKGVQGTLGFVD